MLLVGYTKLGIFGSSAREDFFFERVALAFPQDSPWIKYFDKEITMIVRGGLVKKWKQVI